MNTIYRGKFTVLVNHLRCVRETDGFGQSIPITMTTCTTLPSCPCVAILTIIFVDTVASARCQPTEHINLLWVPACGRAVTLVALQRTNDRLQMRTVQFAYPVPLSPHVFAVESVSSGCDKARQRGHVLSRWIDHYHAERVATPFCLECIF